MLKSCDQYINLVTWIKCKYIKTFYLKLNISFSAGVGRTGTFLAIDQLLDQAKEEQEIDVPTCVCRLRKQRSDLVQTVVSITFSDFSVYKFNKT